MALTLTFGITSIELGSQGVAIRFLTVAGQQYQVEYSSNLGFGNWTPLPGGDVFGDGQEARVIETDPFGSGSRYYRVNRLR